MPGERLGPSLRSRPRQPDARRRLFPRHSRASRRSAHVTDRHDARLGLAEHGVRIVETVPDGLAKLALPPFDMDIWMKLLVPALLISIVGYVESISVAMTFAAKRRQRIDPDQELIALGAANLGSGLSGGFPVTGGLSRAAVNVQAGAGTPAAGAFSAVGIALVALFLTPLLLFVPKAILAAIIVVAMLSMVDVPGIWRTWRYSWIDGAAALATRDLGSRRGARPDRRGWRLDLPAPLPDIETPRCNGGPAAWNHELSQPGAA